MWLQTRMFLLVAILFAILYGVMTLLGQAMGVTSAYAYLAMAFVLMGVQYLIGPALVGWTMKVKWVSEQEEPDLHRMVAELARAAHLPKPKVGISQISVPNAFAYGRTQKDGRICVTQGILKILSKDELRAVLGHEMSHLKHRDMAIITLLSAIPMILYWVAMSIMWGGFGGRRSNNDNGGSLAMIGMAAFILYFITNLLVLYGSRIREYYADLGSVKLGNQPSHMANALYKLAVGDANAKGSPDMKRVEGVKAFFVNDPSRSFYEVREVSQLDINKDGKLDLNDLLALRQKQVKLGFGDKMMEAFTTHPNMVKRIKALSTL